MPHPDQVHQQRRKLLDRARELARSGRHANYKIIIRELEHVQGFDLVRTRFQEYAFLSQLDRMCRVAQDTHAYRQEDEPKT